MTYPTYNFIDKNPVIDELRTAWQDSGIPLRAACHASGLSYGTVSRWFDGATKNPQHASVKAFARAVGYELELRRATRTEISTNFFTTDKVVKLRQKFIKGRRSA